jgi:putative acetyltransferase
MSRVEVEAGVNIRREDIGSSVAAAMIEALNGELSGRYPEAGANHFRLDAEEVADGRGAFLVAYAGSRPVACGAIRRLDAGTAEIKRMYVVPAERRRGFAQVMLARLEAEARALGVARIVLETGVRQPEAIALYTREGFTRIPAFGEYLEDALSVCMAKDL